jgi:hypothetical protein
MAAKINDAQGTRRNAATKDDIASLAGQLTSMERELRGIRRDLDDLREKVENVSGLRKEIDHALEPHRGDRKALGPRQEDRRLEHIGSGKPARLITYFQQGQWTGGEQKQQNVLLMTILWTVIGAAARWGVISGYRCTPVMRS